MEYLGNEKFSTLQHNAFLFKQKIAYLVLQYFSHKKPIQVPTMKAVSIKEASEKLSISPQQVRNLCREEKLDGLKISGSWVIEDKVLRAFMTTSTYGVAEDQPSYI